MMTLVCTTCGQANSDLNPRCSRCGGPLPEISNEATTTLAHEGVAGSEIASQIALLAARRYTKLTEIARGGSGRIVAARDLVFERTVAIKEPLDPQRDGARLRAEAEILAGLQHPSIVPVYDTGVWGDGVPFFAMKRVEGCSLRDAISKADTLERRLTLIPQLVAVADAIAYAHARGVIHRDVKPGNVLVGEFGETIVIDWGLAKRTDAPHGADDAVPPAGASGRARAVIETATGAVLGTPAYMAPEQARGDRVDARVDVYGLGAMLYHLLTGDAPFRDGAAGDALAAAGSAGPTPVEDLQPRAPADLIAIVNKAMAREPAGRYPTAAELADDLRRFETGRLVTARRYSPIARFRRWLRARRSAVLGVVLAAASATIAILAVPAAAPLPPGAQCARSGDRIRYLWDPDHRVPDRSIVLRAALLASGRPSAEDTFRRVAAQLDRYSRDWAAARVDACEATRVRGEQSDALLDLRMACLDQRRDDLDALVRELTASRPGVIDKAVEAAAKLPPLAACTDARALQAVVPPPADPIARASVEAARRTLSTVKALVVTGAYRDGLAAAAATSRSAESLAYAPLLAEALYWRGDLEARSGDARAGEATLRRALLAAADGRADAIAARISADLLSTVGGDLQRPDEALAMMAAGEAAVRRAGNDPEDAARLWEAVATAFNAKGKFEDARMYAQRVVELRERALGADHPDVAGSLVNLASTLSALGRGAEARPLLERALAVFERTLGPDHPNIGATANNLGGVYLVAGQYELALQSYQRALAVYQRALGADHPRVASPLMNRGIVLSNLGKNDDAVRDFEGAAAIFEKALGPDHPSVAQALSHLGASLIDLGRADEARHALERAVAITERALGPTHPALCFMLLNLGELARDRRDYGDARRQILRAQTIWQATLGPDHVNLSYARRELAEVALLQGRIAEARELAERAVQTQEARPHDLELARSWFVLARALWTSPADRPRAGRLSRAARDAYIHENAQPSKAAIELTDWMAVHGVR